MKPRSLGLSIHLALAGAALAAISTNTLAQQQDECVDLKSMPPGLYVTVEQSQVYLIKDDKIVELNPGEAAYANETDLSCLKVPPRVLSWPCDTSEALTRRMAPGYTVQDLPAVGSVNEVVRRYFDEDQAISPQIEWLNGETHGKFPAVELEEMDSSTYWYLPGSDDPFASPKRPKAQLVGLFWATGQAVVDSNTLTPLEIEHADGEIPVVFVFYSDREVPLSFFGPNPTLDQITKAYLEQGVELAPVPVWYAGDHHLEVTIEEFEQLFDIPELDEIPSERQAAIRKELEAYGFSHKPLAVSMMEETGTMVLDQPEIVRVAADMGLGSVPVVMFYYGSSSHMAGCGIEMPQISVVGGATSAAGADVGSPTLPVSTPPKIPDPERNPSDS